MAQAGIHSMVGMALSKNGHRARKWLMLGIVLGNLFPDADNLAVAVATVMGKSTEGLHRTFTHSLFFVPRGHHPGFLRRCPGRQNAPNGATWGWGWASAW